MGPEEILFAYSGGTSSYQRIENMMHWFAALAQKAPACRLPLLTPETDAVARMCDHLKLPGAPVIRSAAHEKVNAYLNAANAAFMLCRRNATNRAASPTKFAEYCMVGFPVPMSDAVAGAFFNAQRFGNFISEYEPQPLHRIADVDRPVVVALAMAALGRQVQTCAVFNLYTRVLSRAETP